MFTFYEWDRSTISNGKTPDGGKGNPWMVESLQCEAPGHDGSVGARLVQCHYGLWSANNELVTGANY